MTDPLLTLVARAIAKADGKDPDAPAWVQGYGNREQTFGVCWRDQYLDKAQAALSVIREQEGWRPIEEAPKDGTRVLLGWHPEGKYAGRVAIGEFGGMNWPSFYGLRATHFRPLPAPPLEKM